MDRCVIIGGADIADYQRVRKELRENDFFICCDSGLRHADNLRISPSLIIGDFDSHEKPETETEMLTENGDIWYSGLTWEEMSEQLPVIVVG